MHEPEVVPGTRRLSRGRKLAAFAVALASDAASLFTELVPGVQQAVDVATALILVALLGLRWQLLPAVLAEAIPGVAFFPSWIAVVGWIVAQDPPRSAR